MEQTRQTLLQVLRQTKDVLSLPGNDFVWSGWDDFNEAIREIDGFISAIENKQPFDKLKLLILFGPTGPIQEVSVSSGWGNAFLDLAKDFDVALEAFENTKNS